MVVENGSGVVEGLGEFDGGRRWGGGIHVVWYDISSLHPWTELLDGIEDRTGLEYEYIASNEGE